MSDPLRVLQATAWYPPRSMGGTEMYVTGLVNGLRSHGVRCDVAVPASEDAAKDYEFDGALVREYPVDARPGANQLSGASVHSGFDRFLAILDEQRPDIYHQHSWTRGLGGFHLKAARDRGLRTVLTVHTADPICLRGTMMRFGRDPCDGLIDERTCAACWSESRGAARPVARGLSTLPSSWSAFAERLAPGSRLATAASSREQARRKRRQFDEMIANADRIVAVSQWVKDALLRSGAPADKVVLSRQGVDVAFDRAIRGLPAITRSGPFRLGFIGRLQPTKGLHVLASAVRMLPRETSVELIIHGVAADAAGRDYEAAQKAEADGDAQISFQPPAPRAEMPRLLQALDGLAAPSLGLETGPLVVLEAQAAGLAIAGSAIGGIAELLQAGKDDWLLPPGDVPAWSRAIAAMAGDVQRLRAERAARRVRTMADAASDMALLYQSVAELAPAMAR